mmetsp:Transcript_1826/g.2882  ORF Transcript_1826/g.2882 Transcript_1826/m.2882 type:complete len:936 (-) Transcript_1826:39-2846(-)
MGAAGSKKFRGEIGVSNGDDVMPFEGPNGRMVVGGTHIDSGFNRDEGVNKSSSFESQHSEAKSKEEYVYSDLAITDIAEDKGSKSPPPQDKRSDIFISRSSSSGGRYSAKSETRSPVRLDDTIVPSPSKESECVEDDIDKDVAPTTVSIIGDDRAEEKGQTSFDTTSSPPVLSPQPHKNNRNDYEGTTATSEVKVEKSRTPTGNQNYRRPSRSSENTPPPVTETSPAIVPKMKAAKTPKTPKTPIDRANQGSSESTGQLLTFPPTSPGELPTDDFPPSPFYSKSKHEAQFHQLQLYHLQQINDPVATQHDGRMSTESPLKSDTDDDSSFSLAGYESIMQKVRMENQSLLELQRKRTMSSMQNAKLEMEVDSLMRQLEQLDRLEQEEERQKKALSARRGGEAKRGLPRPTKHSSPSPAIPTNEHRQRHERHTEGGNSPRNRPQQQSSRRGFSVENSGVDKVAEGEGSSRAPGGQQQSRQPHQQIISPRVSHGGRQPLKREVSSDSVASGVGGNRRMQQMSSMTEKLSVSPIRRAARDECSDAGSLSVVGRGAGKVDEEAKQYHQRRAVGGRRQQQVPTSARREDPPASTSGVSKPSSVDLDGSMDGSNGKSERNRSVLKNLNRRHRSSADSSPVSVKGVNPNGASSIQAGALGTPASVNGLRSPCGGGAEGPQSEPKSFSAQPAQEKGSFSAGVGQKAGGRARGHRKSLGSLDTMEEDMAAGKSAVADSEGEARPVIHRRNRDRASLALKKRSNAVQKDLEGEEVSTCSRKPLAPADPWSQTMVMRRGEVELLLRRPINSDEDIQFTLASAEAGLLFMEELKRVAKSLNVLRGALSRWLLPYDSNTALTDQISSVSSVVQSMPDNIRGKLTEKQVHYLVSGVNGVRQLVRIKIADDNDLDQAKEALQTASVFLKRLQSEAQKCNMSAYELLQSQQY